MTKTTTHNDLTFSINTNESEQSDNEEAILPAIEENQTNPEESVNDIETLPTDNEIIESEDEATGFTAFGLSSELLQAIAEKGYTQPSPIQSAAIPELMLGRDLVGQAQTGTGKTAAFALPLLARMDPNQRSPQVLVLAPTRELAVQVADSFSTYACHLSHVHVLAVYGGADFRDQINRLKRGIQVVVGTPGRVMDHMRQGTLDLSGLRVLVLDEADEMLRMGFIDDVEWVIEQLPEQRQVVLFSATMPTEIRRISLNYLKNPAEITIRQQDADASRIHQRYLMVHAPHKLEALNRVLEAETGEGVIIFGRTKAITVTIAESLEATGHDVAVLNGDVAQNQRERTIERLRKGAINILVATDVAARGLDVDRISLVINYDIPFDSEAYVHRIGRTGRAGRTGDAILFLTPRERRFLGGLERAVGRPIELMDVPNNATINQNRLNRLRQHIVEILQHSKSSSEEQALLAELLQGIGDEFQCDSAQLALAALQVAIAPNPLLVQGDEKWLRPINRDLDRVNGRERRDRNANPGRSSSQRQGGRRDNDFSATDMNMDRFRIEVGWRDRVKPGNIVGAIANEAGIQGRMIGRIQIFDEYSTIDLPKGMPEGVFQSLRYLKVMNKELQISRQN
uniref:RNA helicase n=1 Tax=Paulinella longichromatophora TaxID=1708747 RepID=A0A2H4ZQC6_9EUKA|nr:putative ATP-dependent RNA helicase [Paulinella longichromatophora]